MKQAMTLTQLVQSVEEQRQAKVDYVVPAHQLRMDDEARLTFPVPNAEPVAFVPSRRASQQLTQWAGVPFDYYDRMIQAGHRDLAAANVNRWLNNRAGEGRMIRTMHATARAVLSPRYSTRLDNYDLATAVMPVLAEMLGAGTLMVCSANVSDDFMHIKVTSKALTREIRKGDVVEFGVSIRNSEIGMSSWLVDPFCNRLVCLNGMVIADRTMKRRHVGSNLLEDEASVIYTDRTLNADSNAVVLKTRDAVRAALQDSGMADRIAGQLTEGTTRVIKADNPVEYVQVVSRNTGLTEDEGAKVLQHLLTGGDLTQWGLANAITRAAADVDSYDRATELERLGGDVAVLTARGWENITEKGAKIAA